MTDEEKVRSVVARFFNVPEATVTEDFVFPSERLQGSVGRATFHAAIKRMAGVDLPATATASTFRELLTSTTKGQSLGESSLPKQATQHLAMAQGALATLGSGVGVDIEHRDNLPLASDPWTETFYSENFTPAEIAYCQRRPDPRESFCGIWCAKEAAIKSCSDFARLQPKDLEIQRNGEGRPSIALISNGKTETLHNCAISISHAHGVAVAVCIAGWRNPDNSLVAREAADIKGGAGSNIGILPWVGLGLGILNLLLWLLCIIRK